MNTLIAMAGYVLAMLVYTIIIFEVSSIHDKINRVKFWHMHNKTL